MSEYFDIIKSNRWTARTGSSEHKEEIFEFSKAVVSGILEHREQIKANPARFFIYVGLSQWNYVLDVDSRVKDGPCDTTTYNFIAERLTPTLSRNEDRQGVIEGETTEAKTALTIRVITDTASSAEFYNGFIDTIAQVAKDAVASYYKYDIIHWDNPV